MGKILLGSWWCLSFSGSVYVSTVTSNFSGLFGREHHHHRLLFRVMMILLMTSLRRLLNVVDDHCFMREDSERILSQREYTQSSDNPFDPFVHSMLMWTDLLYPRREHRKSPVIYNGNHFLLWYSFHSSARISFNACFLSFCCSRIWCHRRCCYCCLLLFVWG